MLLTSDILSTGIQTRSRRAAVPTQWTEVPLPVKIVKLLVSDVQNGLEVQGRGDHSQELDDSEVSVYHVIYLLMSCDWYMFNHTQDEDGEFGGEAIETTLESLLAPDKDYPGYDMAEWEMEEDPDLIDEPVLHMDMQV